MVHDIQLELRKFVAPEFIFGVKARELAGRYARNFGARKVLVVSDDGLVKAGWTGEVIERLEQEGLATVLYTDVTPNPRDREVMAGAAKYRSEDCNAIVAVGGGSPMDCAKGIGIVSSNQGHILDYEGVDMVENPLPPLIFIPSTAGSSADVSQFAIINDTSRRVKIAIVSKTIVPDVALIDPEISTTMDRDLTAHTGLDALTHAFEAFVSNAHSPVTDTHALESIRLIFYSLPRVMDHLDDLQLRGKMMLGSLFAGMAFSNASLGIVHAMAHSLGGLLDLPHGVCNALLLEYSVRFNFATAAQRYRRIARAIGIDDQSMSDDDVKNGLIRKIIDLRTAIGVDMSLGQLGMKPEDIRALAENALNDACLVTNPNTPDCKDIENLYEQAL